MIEILDYLAGKKQPPKIRDLIKKQTPGMFVQVELKGAFAECRKDSFVMRRDIIRDLPLNAPLTLETSFYEGKPFYLVVDPVSGYDIGALPRYTSGRIRNEYKGREINIKLIDKNIKQPIISVEVI